MTTKKDNREEETILKKMEEIRGKYKGIAHLITLGKFLQADEELKKLLEKNPEDFTALLLQGLLRSKQGRIGSAVKALERAIELQPQEAHAHFVLGNILMDGLNKTRGLKEVETAVKLNPNDGEYKAVLAVHLLEEGKKKEARKLIHEALAQDPENINIKHNYYTFFADEAKSEDIKTHLLRDNPNDAASLNTLGLTYLHEGDYTKAIETFRAALQNDPGNPLFQENLKVALRSKILFFRPMVYLTKIQEKIGLIGFYLVWFAVLFVAIKLYPPLIFAMVLFAVYTWVATPIANHFIKDKVKW